MSARDDSNTRILAEITEITPEGLKIARQQWVKHNPMRRVLELECRALIEKYRGELEHGPIEDIVTVRGKITGVRETLAMIGAQGV